MLLPLAIGASAATAYAATLKSGAAAGFAAAGAAGAGVSAGTSGAAGGAHAVGAVGGAHAASGASGSSGLFSGATGFVIGVTASVVVVGAAVAGVLVATADPHPRAAAKVAAETNRNSVSTPAPTSPDATDPAPASPTPTATPAPSTPPSSDVSTPTNVPADAGPAAGSDPPATTDPPPVTVTPPATPAAPAISVDTAGGRYYPIVSGTADPAAEVTVSGGGTTITVQADASGAWLVGTAFTGYDAGTGTVTATQTGDDGIASAPASASFTLTAPQASIAGPHNASIALLTIVGTPGATVELLADGTSQGIRRLGGDGRRLDVVLGPSSGHDIAVRYSDAAGRVGPSTLASFTSAG